MRSVNGSRRTWIHSLRSTARKRRKEKPFMSSPPGVWLSRWMNTSSSCGATSCQVSAPASVDRVACSSAARSMPAMRNSWPNTAAASTPGTPRSRRAAISRSAPVASNTTQSAALRHLVRRALHHESCRRTDRRCGRSARPRPCNASIPERSAHRPPCRGSGPRTRGAPWRRPPPSARRAAAASACAERRRPAPAAASSRPTTGRPIGPPGPPDPCAR